MGDNIVLRGLIIGFLIAAPVGPIGVLCIRRTLAEGLWHGLVSGLGAATADAMYGMIAGFGLTFLASLLIGQQYWLRLVGGLFLCFLGIKSFLAKPDKQETQAPENRLLGAYASTLILTLTNPLTILAFAGIFAGLGLAEASRGYLAASLLVLGVFLGSALWWSLLSGGVSLFRSKFTPAALVWVNRLSGLLITGFGLIVLVGLR